MKKNEAMKILELPRNFTKEQLKKQYHIKALRYHPDKINTNDVSEIAEATKKFQSVNDAYCLLSDIERDCDCSTNTFMDINYDEMMGWFVKFLVKNKFSMSVLLELDIELLEMIMIYLNSENKHLDDILVKAKEEIGKIIVERRDKREIILLQPSIDDVMQQKVFKLQHMKKDYYVPLWHSEMVYEYIDGENNNDHFIVKCEAKLPQHIDIDENNNVHIKLDSDIKALMNNRNLKFNIGTKSFLIQSEELKIVKKQTYTIKMQGIPIIDEKNYLNVGRLGDIIVYVQLY